MTSQIEFLSRVKTYLLTFFVTKVAYSLLIISLQSLIWISQKQCNIQITCSDTSNQIPSIAFFLFLSSCSPQKYPKNSAAKRGGYKKFLGVTVNSHFSGGKHVNELYLKNSKTSDPDPISEAYLEPCQTSKVKVFAFIPYLFSQKAPSQMFGTVQKTGGFAMFPGGIKRDQWHGMNYCKWEHRNKMVSNTFLERQNFHIVSGGLPETMRKLCLSTKLSQQEIR